MGNCLKDAPHIPLIVGLRFMDSIRMLIDGSRSKIWFSSIFPERRNGDQYAHQASFWCRSICKSLQQLCQIFKYEAKSLHGNIKRACMGKKWVYFKENKIWFKANSKNLVKFRINLAVFSLSFLIFSLLKSCITLK